MTEKRQERIKISARARLLAMLALLSLPLLVTSLLQLRSYYQTLVEQTFTIARIEAAAAAGALDSWLEDNPHFAAQTEVIPEAAARAIFARIFERATPSGKAVIAVRDARGRLISNPDEADAPFPAPGALPAEIEQQRWSDQIVRVTGARRVEPYGWSVVVGVPLAADTPAGATVLTLMAVWSLTLMFTCLLAVWAVGRFTKPLRHLAKSAAALGEGRLGKRAAVETGDEVGMLAESFNEMAESLQARFDELRAQRAFIEEALDSLPLGVVVLDERLVVLKANRSFAGYVGRPPESLTGCGLYEAAAGISSLDIVVEEVRRTRRPFISYGIPLDLIAGDEAEEAEKFWDVILWPTSKASAERGDLLLILTGVSKRVRAEKLANAAFAAERERAAELESVITQMNEGVIIADRSGRYRLNPAAARIIGCSSLEFRDGAENLLADLRLRDMDGRELAPEATPLGRALESGEGVTGAQVKLVRAGDAKERVLAISATPLVSEVGYRQGAVAVFRDITEEVRQHEELLAAYDRLREHDRLKSAFVANVSHELRTPLNVVMGLCQLLARDQQQPLAARHAEIVERMERNARSLMTLVSDLLEYSQLEAGRSALHLEECDPAQVVAAVARSFAAEARSKGLELKTEIAGGLGIIVTDKQKFSQALTNLLSNAVKFTSEGVIRVAAGPLDAQRWYVEVSDTGIGITPETLRYIFDEFRQGDERLTRAYGGFGLGLAITRKAVELLDGEITVESRPNEGSRFRIVWPRIARARTGTGSLVGSQAEQTQQHNELRSHVSAG